MSLSSHLDKDAGSIYIWIVLPLLPTHAEFTCSFLAGSKRLLKHLFLLEVTSISAQRSEILQKIRTGCDLFLLSVFIQSQNGLGGKEP